VCDAITVDMLLASSAIPLLVRPVRVGEDLLWDGGLLVNTPIAPALALGARRIVPVLATSGMAGAPVDLGSFGVAIERLAHTVLENAYNLDRRLLLDRNALARAQGNGDAERRVIELFRAVRPQASSTFNAGSYLFFEREAMRRMYEAGKRAAWEWLERGPELDDPSCE